MDLYLIRHGQSINNREDTHVDFPRLTDLGYEQAHLAGKALKGINLVKLYCSPMLRSVQTAQKVGSMINLDPVEQDEVWRLLAGREHLREMEADYENVLRYD